MSREFGERGPADAGQARMNSVSGPSLERWKQAQEWELAVWQAQDKRGSARRSIARLMDRFGRRLQDLARPRVWPDDWNMWWSAKFDEYSFLPEHIPEALELGCGPHTNMRLIMQVRSIERATCSDPLAGQYAQLAGSWLAWAHRHGIVILDSHPAERIPFATDFFDLVVMINVLDHVRDPWACLAEATRVTKPEGIFVLGQDLTNDEDRLRWSHQEDLGHPVSLDHEQLDGVLSRRYEPVMRRILERGEGRNPDHHYGTYLFAGAKIPAGGGLLPGGIS